jgi:5-methylcytosine-specific restriction protein A
MGVLKSDFGERLNRMWKVGAKHALYCKDGNWYHILREFPGALFDPHGYVLFKTESEFRGCRHLQISDHVHVPDKISNIPTYQPVTWRAGP